MGLTSSTACSPCAIYMKNILFVIAYYLFYVSIHSAQYLHLIFTCLTFSAISMKNDLGQAYLFPNISELLFSCILCMAIKIVVIVIIAVSREALIFSISFPSIIEIY